MTPEPCIPDDFASLLAADTDTGGAAVPPIHQTSLFTFDSVDAMEAAFRAPERHSIYTRGLNPTVRAFERKVAAMERCENARGFASGMGAISATLLGLLRTGDKVVCVRHVYPDTYRILTGLMERMGIEAVFVDGANHGAVRDALRGARMLYLESPTSMTFEVHDIAALAWIAREAGAVSVIDNSWASPAFQRPAEHGVDLVIHSASKYLSGHSDTVAGIVCGPAEWIGEINRVAYPSLGAKLSPFDAWLLIRGMRTLPMRMRQHHRAGLEIATRLAAHPAVARVRHPGLGDAAAGTLSGYSGLFAIHLQGGARAARAFCDRLRIVRLGVSWGGHESLAFPSQLGLIQPGLTNSFEAFGIPDDMVRLHVGLEDVEDLWRDIEQALGTEAPGEGARKTTMHNMGETK
ncbi:PLP-dependent transferase [uncultured Jannaschia sp.]|uniref:PLP-dependent transferase n=1 Tax=uncultured Jannaschia sp. TaxID=293347 RepID=UPI00261B8622|nr:PLP-dependent transferase [uncultured Jannaschia sp.]